MANTHRGEIEAEIGGKKRRLRLSFDGMANLESSLGIGVLQLTQRFQSLQAGARDIRAVLETALTCAGEKFDPNEIPDAIEDKGVLAFIKPCVDLLNKVIAGAEAGDQRPPAAPGSA